MIMKRLSFLLVIFMIGLSWWKAKGWSMNFKKIIEENFPIEKLQAMIDK